MQKILAQGKLPKDDEDNCGEVFDELPFAKTSKKRPCPPNDTPEKKLTKKPAASSQKKEPSQKSSSCESLEFPGTDRRPPLIFGRSKVYFTKNSYRLMEQMGDRCDVSFSFKTKDPKEVWKVIATRLKELNP